MRKKVIKAHKGMAHVPKPSGQQAPSKAKGTAGTTRRPKRMVGLPQRFMGSSSSRKKPIEAPKISPKTARPILPKVYEDKVEKPVGPIRDDFGRPPPIQSPNKPTGNPFPKGSHNYEVYEARGGRPAIPTIYKPPTQTSPQVVAPRIPRGLRAVPQIRYKGGYISRAKYGIVDNLKKG